MPVEGAPQGCKITGKHLGRLMMKHVQDCNQFSFAGQCVEQVHKAHADFFSAVLSETHRLSVQVVKECLRDSYPGLAAFQKTQVCKLLPEVFANLNRKRRNFATGSQTPQFYNDIFRKAGMIIELPVHLRRH